MPRGLNTETRRSLLPAGSHPQFKHVTLEGGQYRPRNADGVITTPAWEATQLGTNLTQRLDFGDVAGWWYAYVALAGGTVNIRTAAGVTDVLSYAVPGAPSGVVLATSGGQIDNGETRTYAATWYTPTTSYHSGLGATLSATAVSDNSKATISPPSATGKPANASQWQCWVVDSAGQWHLVGTATYNVDIVDDQLIADYTTTWDGPLDAFQTPETLVAPGTCYALTQHKSCLFVAGDNLIRYSEPLSYRYFRDWASLDAGDRILAMVSRGEELYVFTESTIKIVVGNAPNFEIRDSATNEPAVAKLSIVGTDVGVFYLGVDGVRVFNGGVSKNITEGNNRPWIRAIVTPANACGGANRGTFFLADGTTRGLCYDWEQDEFYEKTYAFAPLGFGFDIDAGELVARTSSNYISPETDTTTAVAWALEWPERGTGIASPVPDKMYLDGSGQIVVQLFTNDEYATPIFDRTVLDFPRWVRLTRSRAKRWRLVLKGTGTGVDTVIRNLLFTGNRGKEGA